MAKLAIMVFGRHVGGESALVDRKTRAGKPMFDRTDVIRGLQVPPRPPKNTDTLRCVCIFYLACGT